MTVDPICLWKLVSEGGRQTECHVAATEQGDYQLTVSHDGNIVANETYGTGAQARARATHLKDALCQKGWELT